MVTVENLGTNLVGAYGNAITPTPHIDRFAAKALIADQFWMDGCSAATVLTSMWTGFHASHPARRSSTDSAKPPDGIIQSPGLLVTDSPEALRLGKSLLTGDAILASPPEPHQTAFSSLAAQAFEHWIARMDTLPWLWIHSRGLDGPWDAPYEYRCAMCGEGDPLPPNETSPPRAQLKPGSDPDILFGWACGAGGQAMAIDEVWEWLESALQQLEIAPQCLVALAGVLGYPLGEHGIVGCEPNMHSELLHAPCILRPGESLPLGIRFAPFLQPHHLGHLLNAWIEYDGWQCADGTSNKQGLDPLRIEELSAMASLRREAWPGRHRGALATYEHRSTLLVPGWSAVWDDHDPNAIAGAQAGLFAMPDDRWQQNEIGSRAPDVLQRMRQIRDEWLANSDQSPSNAEDLLSRMDESLWRPHR
ncbi:MAG: hypothetical protein ACK57G_17485 [Planctomycetota bacterium]